MKKQKTVFSVFLLYFFVVSILLVSTSCRTTHSVTQSSYNTSNGDSIVIRYEQQGRVLGR